MSYDTGIGTGFNSSLFYPPYNLGPTSHYDFRLKCYSNIWGLDPETLQPNEYEVGARIAKIGDWCFLSVDGCVMPAHPMRETLESEKPPLGTSGYYWDYCNSKAAIQTAFWDESEITGLPDQIHFTSPLPSTILSTAGLAQEFPVPIEVIYSEIVDGISPTNYTCAYGTSRLQMGRLVISDTGVMEIRGDYTHWGWLKYKDEKGNIDNVGNTMQIINDECIYCGVATMDEIKPGKEKGDISTNYWVGFKPFSLIVYVGDTTTYSRAIANGALTNDDIPTADDKRSYIDDKGRDLNEFYEKVKNKINNDTTMRLRGTIAWFKSLLKRYKSYYESLTAAEKASIQATLYAALQEEAKKFKEFDSYFKITDYIPDPAAATSLGDENGDGDSQMS